MLITMRNQAEEKWKVYHSNLYDEGQSCHLLLEDGRKALFLSGSNKEPFTLYRYQEEVGKDFERISLFLCQDYDFQKWEGNFDDSDSIDVSLYSNGVPNKRQKCDIDLICDTDHKTSTKSRGVVWFSVLSTHTKA